MRVAMPERLHMRNAYTMTLPVLHVIVGRAHLLLVVRVLRPYHRGAMEAKDWFRAQCGEVR